MLTTLRRLFHQFFRNSQTINNEPLNKVSLVVIILIDIFILINVFTGLNDISHWHLSPTQTYPCYGEWNNYRQQTTSSKDYDLIKQFLTPNVIGLPAPSSSFRQTYEQAEVGHLGQVSQSCLKYGTAKDQVGNAKNRQTIKTIDQKQTEVDRLEAANRKIRDQYDSTLLEQIAGQARERSINTVGAEQAKRELDKNNSKIAILKTETSALKQELLEQPESLALIASIKDESTFKRVEAGYRHASFWYPTVQLAFQSFFLLPLLIAAFWVHRMAQRRNYGLISLISWHLLVIFSIPLIIKVFEFLQVGAIFQFIFDVIKAILGGLLFLVSYVYILLIPLVGFGLIKFFQNVVFNPRLQAAGRVQKSRCMRCARKIQPQDTYCPHCGYGQYRECPNCHHSTYKGLQYCKQCGHSQ